MGENLFVCVSTLGGFSEFLPEKPGLDNWIGVASKHCGIRAYQEMCSGTFTTWTGIEES